MEYLVQYAIVKLKANLIKLFLYVWVRKFNTVSVGSKTPAVIKCLNLFFKYSPP